MKRADLVNIGATAIVALTGSLILFVFGAPGWACTMTFLLLWFIVGRR